MNYCYLFNIGIFLILYICVILASIYWLIYVNCWYFIHLFNICVKHLYFICIRYTRNINIIWCIQYINIDRHFISYSWNIRIFVINIYKILVFYLLNNYLHVMLLFYFLNIYANYLCYIYLYMSNNIDITRMLDKWKKYVFIC